MERILDSPDAVPKLTSLLWRSSSDIYTPAGESVWRSVYTACHSRTTHEDQHPSLQLCINRSPSASAAGILYRPRGASTIQSPPRPTTRRRPRHVPPVPGLAETGRPFASCFSGRGLQRLVMPVSRIPSYARVNSTCASDPAVDCREGSALWPASPTMIDGGVQREVSGLECGGS